MSTMHTIHPITRHPRSRAGGFSLMETMMVTLVVAIAAVVVIPGAAAEDPITIQSVGSNLSADLEYVQSATVSNPSDPLVLVVDTLQNRYYVAKASNPAAPIDRPGAPAGTKYEEKLSSASGRSSLDLFTQGVGSYIRFDSMGRLAQESDVVLTLTNGAGTIEIFISAQTGSVSALAEASKDANITLNVFTDPDFNPLNPSGGSGGSSGTTPTLSALNPTPSNTEAAPSDDATNPTLAESVVEALNRVIEGTATTVTETASTLDPALGETVGTVTGTVTETTSTVTGTVTGTATGTTSTVTGTVSGLLGGLSGSR